jgi:uncharacterized protein YjbI with pentapeptide repeats
MVFDFWRRVDFAGMRAKARAFWNELPERGWPIGAVAGFLKAPPKRFVALALLSALVVVSVLFVRLLIALVAGGADEVNKFLLGLAGLLSVPFLVWRTRIADQQKTIAQEELYTGLLVKAVEQLGATREEKTAAGENTVPNTEVRLGAIYALEKLARDCEDLHWQVMEILCAYVRENAKRPRPCSDEISALYAQRMRTAQEEDTLQQRLGGLRPAVDVQVALTVIGRRSERQRDFEERTAAAGIPRGYDRLDLRDSHLACANLCGLHFERADFSGSCLEGANLFNAFLDGVIVANAHLEDAELSLASLKGASLARAWLHGANFQEANASRANFSHAQLQGATLVEASLEKADFGDAILSDETLYGTHLHGASLINARGLTQDQLDIAIGDENTTIPDGLTRPAHWTKSGAGQGG